jgi:hypothetical protein
VESRLSAVRYLGGTGSSPRSVRCRMSRTVAGERPVARAISRNPASGLSLIIAAACRRLAALLSGRSRPSLPSLVFDCGVSAVKEVLIPDTVLSESPVDAAMARSDHCG